MVWRVGCGLREQLLDVGQEAEVEHLVGLVEHHDLDVFEAQQALAGEVEQAAGGADDDLRAGLELLDLALVGLAAVDRDDLGVAVGCRDLEVFGHLHAELAGGHDDERLHAGAGVEAERLDEGEAEAEGLAGAGLGLADDVLAVEGEGDGLGLDREGLDDALRRQRVDHVLVDLEIAESQGIPVWNMSGIQSTGPQRRAHRAAPRCRGLGCGAVLSFFRRRRRPAAAEAAPVIVAAVGDRGGRPGRARRSDAAAGCLPRSARLPHAGAVREPRPRRRRGPDDLGEDEAQRARRPRCSRRTRASSPRCGDSGSTRSAAMDPFRAELDDFQKRTQGADWYEILVTCYLTAGFLTDFFEGLAAGLPAGLSERVSRALDVDKGEELLVEELREAIDASPRLASRLAMWGRRLVGDTMLIARSSLAIGREAPGEDRIEPVFTELIAAHTRRMDALGLTALAIPRRPRSRAERRR